MTQTSKASKYYLERIGLTPTRRSPTPHIELGGADAHRYPLAPPLPHPHLQQAAQGSPPPDTGGSQIWPHGLAGEAAVD